MKTPVRVRDAEPGDGPLLEAGVERARHPALGRSARLALAATLACVAASTVSCGGPFYMLPGGALRGEVVSQPVGDWSFADDPFLVLEVRPGDPYSVNVGYVVHEGRLYVDPAEGRRWLDHLRADPKARVRLDGRIYPVVAVLVAEPGRPADIAGMDPDRFVYRLDSRPPDAR